MYIDQMRRRAYETRRPILMDEKYRQGTRDVVLIDRNSRPSTFWKP